MLLELTVMWYPDDLDPEEEENLGKAVQLKPGLLIVNTDHIVAYHPNDMNQSMIRLTNGDVFSSTMPFKKFRKVMEDEQLKKDMLVSGDN